MRVVLLLLILSTPLYCDSFYTQKEVDQGEPITFVVDPGERKLTYTFTLIGEAGDVVTFKSFRYFIKEINREIILGLGSIPPDLEPGTYRVEAKGVGFFATKYFERKVIVKSANFKSTTIKANPVMNSLANGKRDPLRDIQAKTWWRTLTKFRKYSNYYSGELKTPLEKFRFSSPFGFTREVVYPTGSVKSVHRGEDLATEEGAKIFSGGGGVVVLSENRIISGNTVIVEHLPGVYSMYYHMSKRDVKKGQRIYQGDLIGRVGSTGFSTGPHLHWEVRFGTVPANPLYFIERPLIDKTLIINMIDSTIKKGG